MGKLIAVLLAVLAGIFVFIGFDQKITVPPIASAPSPSPQLGEVVTLNGTQYRIFSEGVAPSAHVSLIPNFAQKLPSNSIAKNNNCASGINAGFYDTQSRPLGYYFAQGKFFNETIHNPTFLNGFVWAHKSGQLTFSQDKPETSETSFLFQTGPYMTPQSNLRIKDDEVNRRMLLAKTNTNEIYLLSMTQESNIHSGPLLAQAPQILGLLSQKFVAAINLDGGSASALITKSGIELSEIVAIGSFICVQ